MISGRFNRFESYFMASACASAPRSLRSTGASFTRLDSSDGDEGLHYAFIGACLVNFKEFIPFWSNVTFKYIVSYEEVESGGRNRS